MNKFLLRIGLPLVIGGIVCAAVLSSGCAKDESPTNPVTPPDTTLTRFVAVNYIDLAKIGRISKFRSGIGHDYSDDSEHCRSMKHYFEPLDTVDWASVAITCPVDATVNVLRDDFAGKQVEMIVDGHTAYSIVIFHIALDSPLTVGQHLKGGQRLGHHIGSMTMSDIAVRMNNRLVSFFDIITDSLFAEFQARGVASRDSIIISRAARDADPLYCSGDAFGTAGTLANWVALK